MLDSAIPSMSGLTRRTFFGWLTGAAAGVAVAPWFSPLRVVLPPALETCDPPAAIPITKAAVDLLSLYQQRLSGLPSCGSPVIATHGDVLSPTSGPVHHVSITMPEDAHLDLAGFLEPAACALAGKTRALGLRTFGGLPLRLPGAEVAGAYDIHTGRSVRLIRQYDIRRDVFVLRADVLGAADV